MRKFVMMLAITLLLTGCGQNQAKTTEQKSSQSAPVNHIAQGMDYLQSQDVPRAIQSFDLAIKEDPTNVDNYLVLGQVYLKLKLYDRAIDTFAASIKVDPNSGEAHYLLATSKALDGRVDGAIEAAQRSVEIFVVRKDQENLKRSVALLKGLTESPLEDATQ